MHEQISIHPSNLYTAYPVQGHREPESIPSCILQEAGYTVYRSPVHHRANTYIYTDSHREKIWRKPRSCKLNAEKLQMASRFKPEAILLRGDIAKHCATIRKYVDILCIDMSVLHEPVHGMLTVF